MPRLKAEDNLAPVRNQIADLVASNSKVIEFGCGKGDLLIQLSTKIKTGLGIDKSRTAIENAIRKRDIGNIKNVEFVCTNLYRGYTPPDTYDYSVACLFFHVILPSKATYLLKKMGEFSDTLLICGFSHPITTKHKFLLWLDQRFSKHYGNFKEYQQQGNMIGLLERARCRKVRTFDTHIAFLKIYKVKCQ